MSCQLFDAELVPVNHQSSVIGDVAMARPLLQGQDELVSWSVDVTDGQLVSGQRH